MVDLDTLHKCDQCGCENRFRLEGETILETLNTIDVDEWKHYPI